MIHVPKGRANARQVARNVPQSTDYHPFSLIKPDLEPSEQRQHKRSVYIKTQIF